MSARKKKNKKTGRSHKAAKRPGRTTPVCGLCGKTGKLIRAECCGNWICDDEDRYVMFSYARNSCHRNHRRLTLCGFHSGEGHPGRWQDCPQCREAFETEMYVWYGTNEYNFEKLPNPPAYEPTTCHACGRVIVLGDGGYSMRDGRHFCGQCTAKEMGENPLPLGQAPVESPGDPLDGQMAAQPPFRLVQGDFEDADAFEDDEDEDALEDDEEILSLLEDAVPDDYRERFAELVALTDAFCDAHLDQEYKEFCQDMAVDVCQEGSPVRSGKPEGWAAGIVYALGRVNFLDDPGQTPHMKSGEIAQGFGVSVTTMQAKAKVIREGLDLMPFHPHWTLPRLMDRNPLAWMFEVNGMIVDIRAAPRDVQVKAYEAGLIPYVPADRQE